MTVIRSGMLQFDNATELTISSGAVTVTQSYHTIDTQGDAASDDLDTITALTPERAGVLYVRAENAARTVVIKDGTGNIQTYANTDIVLDDVYKIAVLVYDSTNNVWYARGAQVDIISLTEDTTPDAEADYIVAYDDSAGVLKRIRLDRFPTSERVIFVQTADKTVGNTTTETTLIGNGRGSVTIAANSATIGTSLHMMIGGYLTNTSNHTLNIKVKLDSTEVVSTGATAIDNTAEKGFFIDLVITFRTLGATGTVVASGVLQYQDGNMINLMKTTATTVDTTQDLTIDVTATWGTADPTSTLTAQTASIHRFTPPTATYP